MRPAHLHPLPQPRHRKRWPANRGWDCACPPRRPLYITTSFSTQIFTTNHSTFYGNETVDVEIARDTRYVLIHVFEQLHVETVSLRDANTNATLDLERFFYFRDNEFLVVETKETVAAGSVVQLYLQFRGLLNESIVGFYKSSYVNSLTNETRHLATSKFEPVSARRAFPCMDEPALKAQFSVKLIHRPDTSPCPTCHPGDLIGVLGVQ
ncbi:hypothetical protein C0Q70_01769 [Pomacea canaliculata]|uniref:Aminopeptidase N-like N-terminal domain-containing protein n=1 Tax=Pomacea canaliculata TaxID=400727 RepID=A0A2T7Q0E3_POMCA|nr:hypothetical protein C0Q70_01769 [Pomacea canaliculata]